MSKFLNILCASLAILVLSKEIEAAKNGLILAFVKNITEFQVGRYGNSAVLEPVNVKGPSNDNLILSEKFKVNYASLTSGPDSTIYPFSKWVEVTTVELSFEQHVGDVRTFRLIGGVLPMYVYLVIEVPESSQPDSLIAKVYGKYVIQ